MGETRIVDLEPSTKYRVRYQIPGVYRVEREMVAVFVARGGNTEKALVFSGRPEFGTTECEERWIHGIWTVDQKTKCYANKKVDDGIRLY